MAILENRCDKWDFYEMVLSKFSDQNGELDNIRQAYREHRGLTDDEEMEEEEEYYDDYPIDAEF